MKYLNQIIKGDAISVLKKLDTASVNTVVTSPPYFGLRDYGVKGQIGNEKTPEDYVKNLVEIFQEIRRVLKDDGTVWLNLGDSYAGSNKGFGDKNEDRKYTSAARTRTLKKAETPGLKSKDLIGIPWRVALALQADGWYLRQDIIWSKSNPMPESVKDRCVKSHEYIFLLSKSPKYFFDYKAIQEPSVWYGKDKRSGKGNFRYEGKRTIDTSGKNGQQGFSIVPEKRNKRSVWNVSTKPFKGAHFATFPTDLITPCVLAGSPLGGVVLDPFMGSGTTGLVALTNSRNYIGIELNSEYIKIAKQRIKNSLL